MKKLLVLTFVVMVAGGALAQGHSDNMMGMFFDASIPFDSDNTNFVNTFAPFNAYIVLLAPSVASVGGYECGIGMGAAPPFVLGVTGPNGWTNFGGNMNHLVGYTEPLPRMDGGTVLATMNMLYTGTDVIAVHYGPSDPASIPDVPVIADGSNPDILIGCTLTCDTNPETNPFPDVVATINGGGVVATENHTLSDVKALFQ
jgi:hypothetical protein